MRAGTHDPAAGCEVRSASDRHRPLSTGNENVSAFVAGGALAPQTPPAGAVLERDHGNGEALIGGVRAPGTGGVLPAARELFLVEALAARGACTTACPWHWRPGPHPLSGVTRTVTPRQPARTAAAAGYSALGSARA